MHRIGVAITLRVLIFYTIRKMALDIEFFLLVGLALLVGLKATHECFGTSPGTLVQLAANHVPTESELRAAQGYPAAANPTILIVIIMMLVLLLGVVLISK